MSLCLCACEVVAPLGDVNEGVAVPKERACPALPVTKVKSVVPPSSGPDWTAVFVELGGSVAASYMDQTEVTVAEYQAWADDNAASFTNWHSWCQWKNSGASNPSATPNDACSMSIPSNQSDPFALDKPIRCVDWCDAEAFCRTARGGRLCARSTGGGSTLPENAPDEWSSACSNEDTTAWPWGDAATPQTCNVGQEAGCGSFDYSCGPVPVESFAGCRNTHGNFDLIGNVAEWIDNCAALGSKTADGACAAAGGSYDDSLESLGCHSMFSPLPKSGRSARVGFRCCYDLTPVERQTCNLP